MTHQPHEAIVPCIVCGATLMSVFESPNQPSGGTEFRTFGHYGSTFWDSFDGEEIIVNICDDCLVTFKERIARQKRYRRIRCNLWDVGRAWIQREMVPYFDGPEDDDPIEIEPEEIGTKLIGYGNIEWVRNWETIKESALKEASET